MCQKLSITYSGCREKIIFLLEIHAKEWYEQTVTSFLFSHRIGYKLDLEL